MGLLLATLVIVFACIVIARASDGFEAAADYLGRNLNEGIKGATINAIGSSLPELLTTFFFLVVLKKGIVVSYFSIYLPNPSI